MVTAEEAERWIGYLEETMRSGRFFHAISGLSLWVASQGEEKVHICCSDSLNDKEAQSMTQNTPSPEENMPQLRELALRLLAPPFDPEARQPQLLVGSLPASLPFDLPLPASCQIVGSFVRNSETIQIVLDTEQTPAEVIAFYTERMRVTGWSEPDFQRRQRQRESGFVHTFHGPTLFTTLCKGRRGPALIVSAFAVQGEGRRTEVRLNLDTRSRNSPCAQSSEIFMDVSAHIPPLEPPAGGRQWGGGGGSNSESASTAATLELESDMVLSLVVAHYARQLEQAGWQRTGEGSSGPMGWHTWEFHDKENEHWLGVFSILRIPGMERTYYLQVNINWVGNRAQ